VRHPHRRARGDAHRYWESWRLFYSAVLLSVVSLHLLAVGARSLVLLPVLVGASSPA
jgi:hypothetical protein